MSKYDDLFDATVPGDSVFADKAALDPLAAPADIVARDAQERQLAGLLNDVNEGYLPSTVSIYGPPGTGKTLTTRRVCREFADRTAAFAVEYVNLKECTTLFSAANGILFALTDEKLGAYEGLDGVFDALWDALDGYPEWTVLLLDEIDRILQDSNYDPSDFFHRLLRGEGRLQRDINLSVWVISNELPEVDLRVDSRVNSVLSNESVFFPPYDCAGLRAVLAPRVDRAFRDGALPDAVFAHGVSAAARQWGDARKALTLFRQAGETAADRGLDAVTRACLDENLAATEREAVIEKLLQLPLNHFRVLVGITGWTDYATGTIRQPVTTADVTARLQQGEHAAELQLGSRAIRTIVTDLETMGLVETWIESRGRNGRVKQLETTFEPQWVREAIELYVEHSADVDDLRAGDE